MGNFEITKKERDSNKECGLKTFLAIKVVTKKSWGSTWDETQVVGKTRASNWAWALSQFTKELGDKYDYIIEARLVINLNEHLNAL